VAEVRLEVGFTSAQLINEEGLPYVDVNEVEPPEPYNSVEEHERASQGAFAFHPSCD
jgi:hypothetical protein